MTRFSKAGDEVPDKHSDNAKQRTRPAVDRGPRSVKAISDLYNKGKEYPLGKTPSAADVKAQKNQFPEDQHDNAKGRYHNDTSGWVRASGEDGPGPCFDHGKLDPSSKPPKPASGLKATGQNMPRSPFSAAYIKPNFNGS